MADRSGVVWIVDTDTGISGIELLTTIDFETNFVQASPLKLGGTPTPKLTPHRHQRQQQAQEDRALHLLEYATVVLNH